MDEVLPLYIFGEDRPSEIQMEILKKAKQRSGVMDKCKPARAVSGCGRCLFFGDGRPDFAVAWANTSWDDPKLSAKIKWVLTGVDGRPHTMQEWLSIVMDTEVREVGQN